MTTIRNSLYLTPGTTLPITIFITEKIMSFVFHRFVFEWRQFVRNPASQEVIKLIPDEILLCSHGGLIYPLDLDTESDYESV